MNRTFSTYLDAARFMAAAIVLLVHADNAAKPASLGVFSSVRYLGNDAVMVFFVLSGLVIAYVVDQKERTFRAYALSRLARLYSVAAPALVLTVLLDAVGARLSPRLFAEWDARPIRDAVTGLTFTNQLWFKAVQPFSNVPYWSLGYEFWYYALFAAICFGAGARRWLRTLSLALFVGVKVLLLFPVWALGAWTYGVIRAGRIGERCGGALFLGSAALYVAFRQVGGPDFLLRVVQAHLGTQFVDQKLVWSRWFLSSYVIGALVSAHFIGAAAIAHRLARWIGKIERPVRYLAGFTFALYLFHFPLLNFFAALYSALGGPERGRPWFVLLPVFPVVWALGTLTERRKGAFRSFFARILGDAPAAVPQHGS